MKENAAMKRRKFLDLIAAGHDAEAACVGADLPLSTTKRADLQAKIQDAMRIGTARIRSELTRLAIADGDTRSLENILAHRTSQIDETEIKVIERVIVSHIKCPHCGFNLTEPASGTFRKLTKLSDPPDPPAIPMDDTQESTDSHSTDQIQSRRTAILGLVQGGNTVVEIPRT